MAVSARHDRGSIKIAPDAIVCEECTLVGEITIGSRTVVHPKARIIAEAGPIVIGDFNIIEELVTIKNRNTDSSQKAQVLIIGNNNVFEVGAEVECLKIGDNNIVESRAQVGSNVELTSGCIIGAMCNVSCNEKLAENTVIYGSNCERRFQRDKPPAQGLQIDFLSKILPNYHHLRKPPKSQKA
ncbi:dynactin subunit 6 [Patella vulgata]|uniref:dynactin subunit 6 n=1 Tax=Patella vulgata TaxID=6465 RepID=UPI0021802ADA|nr:dynactin subunit 6 [Patella vulgata]